MPRKKASSRVNSQYSRKYAASHSPPATCSPQEISQPGEAYPHAFVTTCATQPPQS